MCEVHKICKTCFEDKPITDYYFKKESNTYKNVCKKCVIAGKRIIKDPNNKICKHCGLSKPFSEYQKAGAGKWLQPYCKPCDKIRKDKHRENNTEKYRERALSLYYKHRVLKPKGPFKTDDPEYLKSRRLAYARRPEVKDKKRQADRNYRQKNPDKVRQKKIEYKESGRALQTAKEWQKRKRNDIAFVTKKRLRGRIYVALKRGVKSQSTMILLGCSIDFFKEYFQSLFTEEMTWQKYIAGEIVIDHIKPCVKFDLTDAGDQKKCFHYTNLQPLWKLDNLKKGTTYNEKIDQCQRLQ